MIYTYDRLPTTEIVPSVPDTTIFVVPLPQKGAISDFPDLTYAFDQNFERVAVASETLFFPSGAYGPWLPEMTIFDAYRCACVVKVVVAPDGGMQIETLFQGRLAPKSLRVLDRMIRGVFIERAARAEAAANYLLDVL